MGGLDSVPGAGEEFSVWSSEQDAREAAETFQFQQRSQVSVCVCVYGQPCDVQWPCDVLYIQHVRVM